MISVMTFLFSNSSYFEGRWQNFLFYFSHDDRLAAVCAVLEKWRPPLLRPRTFETHVPLTKQKKNKQKTFPLTH